MLPGVAGIEVADLPSYRLGGAFIFLEHFRRQTDAPKIRFTLSLKGAGDPVFFIPRHSGTSLSSGPFLAFLGRLWAVSGSQGIVEQARSKVGHSGLLFVVNAVQFFVDVSDPGVILKDRPLRDQPSLVRAC